MMRAHRGIALITVLFASVIVLVALAVIVNVGTIQLRRSTEEIRALQAQAGADAGIGWVRAILFHRQGDVALTIGDLATARNTTTLHIDDSTSLTISVAVQIATPAQAYDHQDMSLEQNPYVNETPVQVTSTAVLTIGGTAVAARSTTALLRVFEQASPYSEVAGVIDNAGPVGINSPGDPAGQTATAVTSDLRLHTFIDPGTGQPVPNDTYGNQTWSDGNAAQAGPLP